MILLVFNLLDSLNDDSDASLLDMMPDRGQISLIEQEETATIKNYQSQINQLLASAIASLKPEQQNLLQVYYGEQLTQEEIGSKLNIKQYQVSRRLGSIKKSLLLNFVGWSEKTLHIVPKSDVIGSVNSSLDEWLRCHYNPDNKN